MHWDLPHNPEDLEQREGRVHRYKGHAIRKNVVEYGLKELKRLKDVYNGGDPWECLFDIACQSPEKMKYKSDLIPYWIFKSGSAEIERCVPMLPYSKDIGKLDWLEESLALYRLVFGQARQDELLKSILRDKKIDDKDLTDWLISLQPPDINW